MNNQSSLDEKGLESFLDPLGLDYISIGMANSVKLATKIAMENLQHHFFGLDTTNIFIFKVAGSESILLKEIDEAIDLFLEKVSCDANILFTATANPKETDTVRVTMYSLASC